MNRGEIIQGNSLEVLKTLPDESIDCCITSPPYYGLRDYGIEGQLGLEKTFQEYLDKLWQIFDEVKRVLKKSGTCWVVIGDSYSGSGKGIGTDRAKCKEVFTDKNIAKTNWSNIDLPSKSLLNIPSRFAIGMTDRNWILRNEIIWYKRNCMPQSVKDRFTVDFEKIFFFTKSKNYFFEQQIDAYTKPLNRWGGDNLEANGSSTWDKGTGQNIYRDRNMRPNPLGRNKRCVWDITPKPYKEAHFATFPSELVKIPIKAGCPKDGIVLDPFLGSGTTAMVAKKLGRDFIGIELKPEYIELANKRISQNEIKFAEAV